MRTVAEIASGREVRNVKAISLGKGNDPWDKSVEQLICIKLSFDVVGTGNYEGQLLHAVRSNVVKRVGNDWRLAEIVNESEWNEYSCPGSYERANP
jgi:hypothetical protein